jgi:heptosyltransferase-2
MFCRLFGFFKKEKKQFDLKQILFQKHQNILFIKLFGMGNNVLLLPLIIKVKEALPNATFYFLTLDQNKGVFKNCSFIEHVYGIKAENLLELPFSIIACLSELRKKEFDLIFDFEQFVKISTLVIQLLKTKATVGFDTPNQHRGKFYDIAVPYRSDCHILENFAQIIKSVGINIEKLKLMPIPISEHDKLEVSGFLSKHGQTHKDIFIGVHIGSGINFRGRRWPVENFVKLTDKLSTNCSIRIILTGNKEETLLVRRIIASVGDKTKIIDTSGKFDVAQLAFLISICELFISNDTAPVHIATAMDVPIVAFYGPNTPDIYGPYTDNKLVFYKRLSCSPCLTNLNAKTSFCLSPKCMRAIEVEEVYNEINRRYLDKFQ